MQGFYNVIKPTGVSSAYIVGKIKKILKQKRVGHMGTLDPAAAGVLTIGVGKATRFFDYFLNKDKVSSLIPNVSLIYCSSIYFNYFIIYVCCIITN